MVSELLEIEEQRWARARGKKKNSAREEKDVCLPWVHLRKHFQCLAQVWQELTSMRKIWWYTKENELIKYINNQIKTFQSSQTDKQGSGLKKEQKTEQSC